MAEWVAATPWWIWLIASLTVGGLLFRAGVWVGAVNTDRASFKAFTEAVRNDIRELQRDIKTLLRWQDSPTIASKSPLRLTKIGKKVSDTLNMPSMAETLVPILKSRVAGMSPYDIQEFCFDYIRDEHKPNAEDEKRIKDCAYDNGLDRDDVMDVLAIMLRDKLLEPQEATQPEHDE